MSCGEDVERDEELGTDLGDVVQSLIAEAGNSARLLECYYWNQEPGLLEMIRMETLAGGAVTLTTYR